MSGGYDWTGFYLGTQGGYGIGDGDHDVITDGTGFLNLPTGPDEIDGFFAGGFAGYDHQFGNFVAGVNGEFNYSEIGGRFNNFNPGGVAQGDEYRTDVEWFASVRGRLGFIFPSAPELMAYAIGGVAFARIEGVEGDALNGSLNCANDCAKDKITDVGYTVGGGLAWQLPRSVTGMTVIINLEYAYYDFGTNEFSTTAQTSGSPHVFDAETDFHTGRIGVGIKF